MGVNVAVVHLDHAAVRSSHRARTAGHCFDLTGGRAAQSMGQEASVVCRFEVFVVSVVDSWRVVVNDNDERVDGLVRDFASEHAAVAYGRGIAQNMRAAGFEARLIVGRAGGEVLLQ